jgi:hypothetical protein
LELRLFSSPLHVELEEIGVFVFEYLIVKPFQHDNLSDVLARTYWSTTLFLPLAPLPLLLFSLPRG